MSPFAAQVKVLRKLMRSSAYGGSGYWDVNIGPLEAFQGLEKRAVIICTTRSRNRFVQEDVKHGLGIVHFPRKMNVALTRAMEALVVIGNPAVLKEDPHWREWLAFCSRNGLVQDGAQVIEDGHPDGFGNMKIGVLERALLAKEEKESSRGESRKVLGGSAVVLEQDVGGEYEAWLEGLREALEDEEEREVENEEETEEDVEHPDGHDLDDEHVEESLDITS
jgi:helicase MOV-10